MVGGLTRQNLLSIELIWSLGSTRPFLAETLRGQFNKHISLTRQICCTVGHQTGQMNTVDCYFSRNCHLQLATIIPFQPLISLSADFQSQNHGEQRHISCLLRRCKMTPPLDDLDQDDILPTLATRKTPSTLRVMHAARHQRVKAIIFPNPSLSGYFRSVKTTHLRVSYSCKSSPSLCPHRRVESQGIEH